MLPRPMTVRSAFEAVPARLTGSSSLDWLPRMDSHHHSRIQNPVSYCWTTWQFEMILVLPPGFAPGPRPHLGLTDHKSAVLLLHHGRENWSRAWDLRPALPLTGRARRFLRLRGSLQMVPIRGFAPRSADYRSAALTPELYGQKLAEAGGLAPQAGFPARSVFKTVPVRLSGSASKEKWSPRKELHPDDDVRSVACYLLHHAEINWSSAPDSHRVRAVLQTAASSL